ncbi:MAG TPA: peptidoglycan binding domain-containing protein [Roseiflexaceae bacterium]|nr:peptidoglycan binding domain-containing protein [Roseiflexaceae bacterium]
MSAEEMYSERGAPARRLDDPYLTRPLHEITERPADLPLLGPPTAAPRLARRPPQRGASAAIYLFLSLLVLLMLGTGGGLYYLDRSYQGRIYPNVTVQGLNVGELTPQEAEAALRSRYVAFLQRPVTLTYGEQTWQPGYADVGINFDFKGAIDSAYRAGRGNGMIANLQEVYAIWQNGLELPIHVAFDQNKLRDYVAGVSAELERAPVDARLQLTGTAVTTQPAQVGQQVLVDQTVAELTAALATFQPQTVALQTRELAPRLEDAAVADARARIEAILQGPLTLEVEKKQYIWQPEEIALMLNVGRVPQTSGSDTIAVELNAYQIGRRVRQIADDTGRGSVNPRLDWNNGDLRILKPGKPGLRLDEAQTSAAIAAAITGANRVLALPVREVAPQVTEANLHQLGINELVSVGRSDFTGSAEYRIKNIGVGMNILNGILIAPGEEFSFNNNIGSIDARNGFVEGYAIIQDRTQLEFGGGICQDSTTLFRAAFWAGLPITERWGHSFYISWYDKYALGPQGNGPGLDATIFTGGPDLKFVNDTGNWLLMQSTSNPRTGVAEIALYGTKLNRTVELQQSIRKRVPAPTAPKFVTDPKQPIGTSRQSDHARGGMTIDVYRTITENGVRKQPELFQTNFRAWPNIFVFNPADMGPDGKPLIGFGAQPAAQPTPAPTTEQPAPEQPAPEQPAPEQPAPEQPAPEQPATSDG